MKKVSEILKELEMKRDEEKEYLDYLKREKKEAHMFIYDDAAENPNINKEKEEE